MRSIDKLSMTGGFVGHDELNSLLGMTGYFEDASSLNGQARVRLGNPGLVGFGTVEMTFGKGMR